MTLFVGSGRQQQVCGRPIYDFCVLVGLGVREGQLSYLLLKLSSTRDLTSNMAMFRG